MNKWTNRRSMVSLAIAVSAVILLIWVLIQTKQTNNELPKQKIAIGALAPDFEITNTSGQKIILSDYRGKTVLLNFWASWCKPCVREMPLLDELYRANESNLELISVNVGDSRGTVNAFLTELDISFPVIIDITGKVSDLYRVIGLPATFIIDASGTFRQVGVGELTSSEQVQALLKAGMNS